MTPSISSLGFSTAWLLWHSTQHRDVKLDCVYCGYGNGVIAYVREVVGQTELYWCPIRHATRVHGPHGQYRHFVDYGDAQGYRRRFLSLRKDDRATLASKVRKSRS